MPLVPEKRLDKNFRLVTRHVRVDKKRTFSVPPVTLPLAHDIELTERQTCRFSYLPSVEQFSPDRDLLRVLDGPDSFFDAEVSDVEGYAVTSFLKADDAILFFDRFMREPEEITSFIEDNGLDRLMRDDSNFMREALRRKIPFFTFTEFSSRHDFHDYDEGRVFDALEIMDHERSSRFLVPEGVEPLYQRVLEGKISISDVRSLGLRNLDDARDSLPVIFDELERVNAGESKFSLNQLESVVDTQDKKDVGWAIRTANEIDPEFVLGLKRITLGRRLQETLIDKHGAVTSERFRSLAEYDSQLSTRCSMVISLAFLEGLHDAGVPTHLVEPYAQSDLTLDQVVAIHKENVASSIATGWL